MRRAGVLAPPSPHAPPPQHEAPRLAAAQTAIECRAIGLRHSTPGAGGGVVCTVGIVNVEPKIVTAVPGVCEISLDQRALDPAVLASMLLDARAAADRCARENKVQV